MTTAINSYVTLADFLQWFTPLDTSADTVEDAVANSILEAASRYIDDESGRMFYPRIETRYYSFVGGRELVVDDELLEIISITNGDGTSVASSEYHLIPKNKYPKYAIKLKDASTTYWQLDASGNSEYVIAVKAWWAYHTDYSLRAWKSGGTLNGAISDTTTLAWTAATGHSFSAGQIVKIDDEIQILNAVSNNTVTPFARGDNGSTAATHTDGTTVYVWQPPSDIVLACKLISQAVYRRFGGSKGTESENIVTASGVIIQPRDVPPFARSVLSKYRNYL